MEIADECDTTRRGGDQKLVCSIDKEEKEEECFVRLPIFVRAEDNERYDFFLFFFFLFKRRGRK